VDVDVGTWLRYALVAFGVMVAGWAVLAVLATRLPPGMARDLVAVLPQAVRTARTLARDPRVPRRAKLAVAVAGLWCLSPIDLVPEFLPVIGPLDDIVVVALALRYAARRVPPDVLAEAWPGEPAMLDRLVGAHRSRPAAGPGAELGADRGEEPGAGPASGSGRSA
jgi:uncharacterized membrane protein YkvA (DUF1232 family)